MSQLSALFCDLNNEKLLRLISVRRFADQRDLRWGGWFRLPMSPGLGIDVDKKLQRLASRV
jgi:L-alanine-DL-glutamate epimerase-like enolase superfamily enzyme